MNFKDFNDYFEGRYKSRKRTTSNSKNIYLEAYEEDEANVDEIFDEEEDDEELEETFGDEVVTEAFIDDEEDIIESAFSIRSGHDKNRNKYHAAIDHINDADRIEPLVNALDKVEQQEGCDITWNFGRNKEGQMTAGVDVYFHGDESKDDTLDVVENVFANFNFIPDESLGYSNGPKRHSLGNGWHYQIIENEESLGESLNEYIEPYYDGGALPGSVEDISELGVGDKVSHSHYGNGVVDDIKDGKVYVIFDNYSGRRIFHDGRGIKFLNKLNEDITKQKESLDYSNPMEDFKKYVAYYYYPGFDYNGLSDDEYYELEDTYYRERDRYDQSGKERPWANASLSESVEDYGSFEDYIYSHDSSGKYISGEMSDEEYDRYYNQYMDELETEREEDSFFDESLNEARQPKYWNTMFAEKVRNAFDKGELTFDNIEEWDTAYNGGIKPQPPFNTRDILNYYIKNKDLTEDTIKQNGKWVNKGKKGTHGKFETKKEADAQRKAMFANGFHAG